MEGIIFDIERFAVHDGPGIRTALFTKGCRLNCIWCHNPEGILLGIQIWQFHSKCIGCLQCISVCPEKAIRKASGLQTRIVIDRGKCTLCGKCVDICPTKALAFDGQIMSSEEVIEELLKDLIF
jgi:pyruvate formate lyase activating enzyme